MKLLHARVCSVIILAANFASPVSCQSLISGNRNFFVSSEASVRPAFLTGDSSDMNGLISSSCVRKYSGMVIAFISSCKAKFLSLTCCGLVGHVSVPAGLVLEWGGGLTSGGGVVPKNLVWNRVRVSRMLSKMIFGTIRSHNWLPSFRHYCLLQGDKTKGFKKRASQPSQIFGEYPPPPGVSRAQSMYESKPNHVWVCDHSNESFIY